MNGIPVLDRPARRYTGGLSTATAGPGAGTSPMSWHGRLELRYRHDPEGRRTVGHDRHDGPLRVLASLHPEGPGVCHHVLVHPPGGIVGGDVLEIDVEVQAGAHALITTPGATRFYRSAGPTARQHLRARVASGARLEWLPLETIAYDGVRAVNAMRFELDDGAEMIGWDLLALGLPSLLYVIAVALVPLFEETEVTVSIVGTMFTFTGMIFDTDVVQLERLEAIPEPSVLGLVALGTLYLVRRRRG